MRAYLRFCDFLAQTDKSQKIKVTSEEGSSFWYIGTVEDMQEKLSDYTYLCRVEEEQSGTNAKKRLTRLLNNPPNPVNYVKAELEKRNPNPSKEAYLASLDGWFRAVVVAKNYVDETDQRLRKFASLGFRKVVDVARCDRTEDPGYLRVTVDGFETGAYWTSDEALELPACRFRMTGGSPIREDVLGDED